MIIKVGVCGATGKMGLEISALIASDYHVDGNSFEFADAIAGTHKIKSVDGIPVRSMNDFEREPAHVWIDFSRPEATLKLLKQINVPLVIGTTGFSESEFAEIKRYAEDHPVLFAPNMAPGMNALMSMLEQSGLSPELGFEVLGQEIHHKQKKDSPSGTMKRLVEILKNKGFETIPVQSGRVGETIGVHTLKFVSNEEEITLEHRVSDRKVFARGALLGACFLLKKKQNGFYTYAEVVSL